MDYIEWQAEFNQIDFTYNHEEFKIFTEINNFMIKIYRETDYEYSTEDCTNFRLLISKWNVIALQINNDKKFNDDEKEKIIKHKLKIFENLNLYINSKNFSVPRPRKKSTFVTIIKIDTSKNGPPAQVSERKEQIEEVLELATEIIKKYINENICSIKIYNAQKFWNIFVAPEYTFQSFGGANNASGRQLMEGEKIQIESWLQKLSFKYSKTLIFPGSISWKKPLIRNELDYINNKINQIQMRVNTKMEPDMKQELIDYFKTRFENKIPRIIKSINALKREEGNFNDDMIASNFFKKTENKRLIFENEKFLENQEKYEIARNTSLIYFNGRKKLKYNKVKDYHEVYQDGNIIFIPGYTMPVFELEGINYGVEICLDHHLNALKYSLEVPIQSLSIRKFGLSIKPDVMILMSAEINLIEDSYYKINENVVIVHSCSNDRRSIVTRKKSNEKQAPTVIANHPKFVIYKYTE